jgi:hypothetical protein
MGSSCGDNDASLNFSCVVVREGLSTFYSPFPSLFDILPSSSSSSVLYHLSRLLTKELYGLAIPLRSSC